MQLGSLQAICFLGRLVFASCDGVHCGANCLPATRRPMAFIGYLCRVYMPQTVNSVAVVDDYSLQIHINTHKYI